MRNENPYCIFFLPFFSCAFADGNLWIWFFFSYIEEEDLLRFMIKEEVDLVLPLFDCAETGKITRKAFNEWVVSLLKHFHALYS